MEALFGSLPEMLDFQKVFLQTLEERLASCPDLGSMETPGQLQVCRQLCSTHTTVPTPSLAYPSLSAARCCSAQ